MCYIYMPIVEKYVRTTIRKFLSYITFVWEIKGVIWCCICYLVFIYLLGDEKTYFIIPLYIYITYYYHKHAGTFATLLLFVIPLEFHAEKCMSKKYGLIAMSLIYVATVAIILNIALECLTDAIIYMNSYSGSQVPNPSPMNNMPNGSNGGPSGPGGGGPEPFRIGKDIINDTMAGHNLEQKLHQQVEENAINHNWHKSPYEKYSNGSTLSDGEKKQLHDVMGYFYDRDEKYLIEASRAHVFCDSNYVQLKVRTGPILEDRTLYVVVKSNGTLLRDFAEARLNREAKKIYV